MGKEEFKVIIRIDCEDSQNDIKKRTEVPNYFSNFVWNSIICDLEAIDIMLKSKGERPPIFNANLKMKL